MTETALLSRPWTQAEDDKLRRLALTGLSSRAIGIQMNLVPVSESKAYSVWASGDFDAYIWDTRTTPSQAYAFARGAPCSVRNSRLAFGDATCGALDSARCSRPA